ncbi:MAG: N-acetyl-gamma-glutamyl-phosphate reductase, partial [Limosilactobacillus fermentum]
MVIYEHLTHFIRIFWIKIKKILLIRSPRCRLLAIEKIYKTCIKEMKKMKVALIGITGYGGMVLYQMLKTHPGIDQVDLYAR